MKRKPAPSLVGSVSDQMLCGVDIADYLVVRHPTDLNETVAIGIITGCCDMQENIGWTRGKELV